MAVKQIYKKPTKQKKHFLTTSLKQKLINHLMYDGKKTKAEKILLATVLRIKEEGNLPYLFIQKALKNVSPVVEIRAIRRGRTSYQIPVPISIDRQCSLGIRWIIDSARKRKGKCMSEKLYEEFSDAVKEQGGSVRKRKELHKLASANRAFAHYRWY